jgi:hypothetical protein
MGIIYSSKNPTKSNFSSPKKDPKVTPELEVKVQEPLIIELNDFGPSQESIQAILDYSRTNDFKQTKSGLEIISPKN